MISKGISFLCMISIVLLRCARCSVNLFNFLNVHFSFFVIMNQEEKIKELAKTGMKKKDIELKLHELYGTSSVKSSTIYKYIAEAKFSPEALEKHEKPGPERDFQLLMRIKDVLDEMLFA